MRTNSPVAGGHLGIYVMTITDVSTATCEQQLYLFLHAICHSRNYPVRPSVLRDFSNDYENVGTVEYTTYIGSCKKIVSKILL